MIHILQATLAFLKRTITPRSRDEDEARREFILSVLLVSVLVLFSGALLVHVIFTGFELLAPTEYQRAFPLSGILIVLAFFSFLLWLARRGMVRAASFMLVGALFVLAVDMGYLWGFDVPVAALFFVLIIVMSGVLIGTRFAFLATGAIVMALAVLGYMQIADVYPAVRLWKDEPADFADVTMTAFVFLIIATVSWLSNREIEKSLVRARRSEAELKEERDLLELRVEERTRQLRQAEMERMSQAYRFVEFGRLASGFFHDLTNPLLALSLNIEHMAEVSRETRNALTEDVARAKRATQHVQSLMDALRKHLAREGAPEEFSPQEALTDLIDVLAPYARTKNVSLELATQSDAVAFGRRVAFTQVCTNLISNAVESYPPLRPGEDTAGRRVVTGLSCDGDTICMTVQDFGAGIPPDKIAAIFEPFFTTKSAGRGLGIGLPLAKRIVEKEFGGTMRVESAVGAGTTFTICFPARYADSDGKASSVHRPA